MIWSVFGPLVEVVGKGASSGPSAASAVCERSRGGCEGVDSSCEEGAGASDCGLASVGSEADGCESVCAAAVGARLSISTPSR